MERKIENLREAIKKNANLTEEFKCNLGTLTDAMISVFPNYEYTNYEEFLSTLKVLDDTSIDGYSDYNKENNSIVLNTSKIFEDRIDLQHLFLGELLKIGSGIYDMSPKFDGFNAGITEAIVSTMNNDESMKKLNPLEYIGISVFSKVVDPEVLINSYMNKDLPNIVVHLETMGISSDTFENLLDSFNQMSDTSISNNDSFSNALVTMTEMYSKVVEFGLKNGQITYDDISAKFSDFSEMIVSSKSELIALYPHHDFSNLSGFDKINNAIENCVISIEMVDVENKVK